MHSCASRQHKHLRGRHSFAHQTPLQQVTKKAAPTSTSADHTNRTSCVRHLCRNCICLCAPVSPLRALMCGRVNLDRQMNVSRTFRQPRACRRNVWQNLVQRLTAHGTIRGPCSPTRQLMTHSTMCPFCSAAMPIGEILALGTFLREVFTATMTLQKSLRTLR